MNKKFIIISLIICFTLIVSFFLLIDNNSEVIFSSSLPFIYKITSHIGETINSWYLKILTNGKIITIKAEHLDSNRSFISDIYEEVKVLDGVWSETIPNGDYVRVTFEIPLDNSKDITIYPRTVSGNPRIEIYEINGIDLIAEFTSLDDNEYNKVFLTGLNGSQDVFDLKILDGSVEFDYIIDPSNTNFNSTWDTSKTSTGSSNTTQIKLPLESSGTYNFNVDWGDGNSDLITTYNQAEVTHNYASAGVYNVSINGTIIGFRFNNGGDRLKISDISNWGDLNLGNSNGYFYGAGNLDVTATDQLNLTGTTDMSNMFRSATNFNGNISNWDTSSVIYMQYMFYYATNFNQDIGNWNVSSVTTMVNMFYQATNFNGNISNWDTSKVTTMYTMFYQAANFNQKDRKSTRLNSSHIPLSRMPSSA